MLEDDDISVATGPAPRLHSAITRGTYRRPGGSRIVHTLVSSNRVEDRMLAARIEARADATEIHGRAQERLVHAAPVGREIVEAAVRKLVTHSTERAAVVDELRGDDRPIAHQRPVLPHLLVDDGEFIALADIENKVDVPTEDVCECERRLIGNAGSGRRFEE